MCAGCSAHLNIVAAFPAVSTALRQIDPATPPAFLQSFITSLQAVFSMPAVVFIVTWIRNVYGYYRAKAHALAQGQQINNNLNELYETIGLYMGSAVVFLTNVPQPYEIVALAIIFASDAARTEFAAILK